jgi:hypothetical protein
MTQVNNCPICHSRLEVRDISPCYVCGGWHGIEPKKPYHEMCFSDGSKLTLCHICWLEDFLSDQGDLKERLKIHDRSELSICPDREHPVKDKFCTKCNQRFAMLKLMVHRLTLEEIEFWRQKST